MPERLGHEAPRAAVAGWGVISAAGNGADALRQALERNVSALRPSPRFDPPRYQSNVVGAALLEANEENPAHRLAVAALTEARTHAAVTLAKVTASRLGLVLATTKANLEALERLMDGRPCSESARRHLQGDALALDLAAEFGARGPVQCVSAACTSGLVALQQGARIIQRGEADAVLVVGVDHLSPFVMAGFTALKAIDPSGCRPFDRDRCGLSPGEAGAAIVLARGDLVPSPALTIRGWGTSNDANHMTGPSRDGSGLAQAIRAALAVAQLRPTDVDYINVHGTGTPYNDAMESLALRAVFGEACPPFSGLKGMLGHTLGAAGVVETIACLLAMRHGFLPGTPRLSRPAEGVPSNIVAAPRPVARLNHVLKLNTGFGGINGALLLSHE